MGKYDEKMILEEIKILVNENEELKQALRDLESDLEQESTQNSANMKQEFSPTFIPKKPDCIPMLDMKRVEIIQKQRMKLQAEQE